MRAAWKSTGAWVSPGKSARRACIVPGTDVRDLSVTGRVDDLPDVPVRIGDATVFPGDVVLAKREGVIFIPPQLLGEVVITAEFIMLRDTFGHQRLKEGKYTPGQIDGSWTPEIKQDFLDWLDRNPDLLPMSRQELDRYMKDRTW